MKTGQTSIMEFSRILKFAAAALLTIYSANSHAILILDVDIGGTNQYNNTVTDGDDYPLHSDDGAKVQLSRLVSLRLLVLVSPEEFGLYVASKLVM